MPTPNRGLQAAALAQVQWAVRLLEKSLPMIGVGTEPGKAIMKALTSLSKHVPPGSTSPGVEHSALSQSMMESRQQQPQVALLRALGQGQGPPGAGMGGPMMGGAGMGGGAPPGAPRAA